MEFILKLAKITLLYHHFITIISPIYHHFITIEEPLFFISQLKSFLRCARDCCASQPRRSRAAGRLVPPEADRQPYLRPASCQRVLKTRWKPFVFKPPKVCCRCGLPTGLRTRWKPPVFESPSVISVIWS